MRFILNLTLGILLLAACGNVNNSSNEKLYADYMIRYLSESNQLSVKAKYKKIKAGESETAYFPEDGVFFGDKPMLLKSMQGVTADYYAYNKTQLNLPKIHSFQLTDHKGQLIQHNVEFSPMENLSLKKAEVSIDSGFALVWEGDTLSGGQELAIIIEQNGITPIKLNKVGSSPFKSLSIRKEQLKGLKKGQAKITIVQKKYKRYPNESEVGGSFIIEYYHPSLQIAIY